MTRGETNMILETEELRLLPADPALAQQAADYYRRNRDFFAPIDPITADPIDTAEYQRDILVPVCHAGIIVYKKQYQIGLLRCNEHLLTDGILKDII